MKENKTQTEIHTGTILLKVTFSSEMCKRILHIIICFTSGGKKSINGYCDFKLLGHKPIGIQHISASLLTGLDSCHVGSRASGWLS